MLSISLTGKQLVYFDYRCEAFDGMNLDDYKRNFIEEFGPEPNTDVQFMYFETLPEEYKTEEGDD